MNVFAKIARALRAYSDRRQLEQLDDAALKDIGLDRMDIKRIVDHRSRQAAESVLLSGAPRTSVQPSTKRKSGFERTASR
jgi:uncharacterized protein YjiS (DUF1127 family)